jgi:hypothetical protein
MRVHLSGTQTALLVASGVAFIGYAFRDEGAAEVRSRFALEDVCGFAESVTEQWRGILAQHGLDAPTSWASKDYSTRAGLDVALDLSPEKIDVAKAAVNACLAEFSNNWIEFMLVAPGAIDRYRVTSVDLAALLVLLSEVG